MQIICDADPNALRVVTPCSEFILDDAKFYVVVRGDAGLKLRVIGFDYVFFFDEFLRGEAFQTVKPLKKDLLRKAISSAVREAAAKEKHQNRKVAVKDPEVDVAAEASTNLNPLATPNGVNQANLLRLAEANTSLEENLPDLRRAPLENIATSRFFNFDAPLSAEDVIQVKVVCRVRTVHHHFSGRD